MLIAFVILVTDVIYIFTTNHPLNHLVQSWDVNKLPANVQNIKSQIVKAFNLRVIFMISSFIMVLLAVWLHKKS